MSTIDNKKLWSIIDALRDDVNIYSQLVDKLQKENKQLETIKNDFYDELYYDEWKVLKEENRQLKKDIKHDSKVNEDYEDELIKENKRLKELVNNSVTNKDLTSEANDYFHHNPNSKCVGFFMLDDKDIKRGEDGDLYLYEDDAINIIYNDNV